jgi:hypothetical protein
MVPLRAYAWLGITPADFAARYRAYAERCIALVKITLDIGSKLSLLDMARAWLDLADQAEENGGRSGRRL